MLTVSDRNIVETPADVIVAAANAALSGGGGVDGAIHRAAGPALLAECRTLGACPVGSAVCTSAYDLPARWVIHAVGPAWSGGESNEVALLESTYDAVFVIARELGARTLSIPAISCGAYRFPENEAARIAVAIASAFCRERPEQRHVTFFPFERRITSAYRRAIARYADTG